MSKTLNRMISGITYVPYNDNLYSVRPASILIRQRADCYYEQLLHQHRFDGMVSKDKLLKACVRKGLLESDFQKSLDKGKEKIDDLKKALYKAGPRITVRDKLRKELATARSRFERLASYVDKIKKNSLEGFARTATDTFTFMSRIYDERTGEPVFSGDSIDATVFNHIIFSYGDQSLTDSALRKFARSGEWRQLWSADKHEVFNNKLIELSEEQMALYQYSQLYDFAYQVPKTPSEEVFNDDDLFDGWYLVQIAEGGQGNDDNMPGEKDEKYDEIYVVAQDQKEANHIYSQNTPENQKIIRERQQFIQKRGKVKAFHLPDVQREIQMAATKESVAKATGKG